MHDRVCSHGQHNKAPVVFNGLSLRDVIIPTLYFTFVRRSYNPRGSIN